MSTSSRNSPSGRRAGPHGIERNCQPRADCGRQSELTNTTTGTIRLRAQFENKQNELFPNEFVDTRLLVRTVQCLSDPISAIQHNGVSAFVYVVSQGKAHSRTIKPGVEEFAPGELLADSNFEKLQFH
jgi:multidrug efflux system membrane fusion protein